MWSLTHLQNTLAAFSQFGGLSAAFTYRCESQNVPFTQCLTVVSQKLYERAMGVKPVILTSNHSDSSDQSNIKDGDAHKTEESYHFLT